MHRYESLTFQGTRPPQVIIGDSGVELSTGGPQGNFCTLVDGLMANGSSIEQFGFLNLSFNADGSWSGSVVNPPDTVATCNTANLPGPLCELAVNPHGGVVCPPPASGP